MRILRSQMADRHGESGYFTEEDWTRFQGTYTGGMRGPIERTSTAPAMVEHTLGRYHYYTDKYGNIIVTDTYDFNKGNVTQGQEWYTVVDILADKYGSSDKEPDEQKFHYHINLGNPKYGWKIITEQVPSRNNSSGDWPLYYRHGF